MTEQTQVRSARQRPGGRSNPTIMIVLFSILVVVIAIFCWLAFSHQTHDGHGQADPTKQSMILSRHATAA